MVLLHCSVIVGSLRSNRLNHRAHSAPQRLQAVQIPTADGDRLNVKTHGLPARGHCFQSAVRDKAADRLVNGGCRRHGDRLRHEVGQYRAGRRSRPPVRTRTGSENGDRKSASSTFQLTWARKRSCGAAFTYTATPGMPVRSLASSARSRIVRSMDSGSCPRSVDGRTADGVRIPVFSSALLIASRNASGRALEGSTELMLKAFLASGERRGALTLVTPTIAAACGPARMRNARMTSYASPPGSDKAVNKRTGGPNWRRMASASFVSRATRAPSSSGFSASRHHAARAMSDWAMRT